MQLIGSCLIFFSFLLVNFFIPLNLLAKVSPALGVISNIKGEVKSGSKNNISKGFNGRILHKRHRVRTEKKSGATVFIHDGSEIRIFGSTELTIGAKKSRNSRWVRYRIVLHKGSFWGNFVRGDNAIEIFAGGLLLKFSDSIFRLTKKKTGNNISVSSGIIKVFNKVSSVKISAGQRLYHVSKTDFLPQKITLVPNQLKLQLETPVVAFNKNRSSILKLLIKVVRVGTDTNVKRSGPLLLSSNYYNLTIPDSIKLNENGQAKVSINLKPPSSSDRTFANSIHLNAIVDQYGYDDLLSAKLNIKINNP